MLMGAFKSITIWFNSVIGAVMVAVPLIQEALPQLETILSPVDYQRLITALIIGNVLLRIKTTKALTDK